ncbi:cobalamin-binding protein [Tenacibaculum todarodis]|uniref:Cobalamin-binding protein n=1 Tax=Tenacibaculum todarodis TaxID=1850252 RepID=A0A1L3JJ24_9FLAO|nr:helical backbone metal receptor [Tenacibaculum todarodis]APG65109.1 cobalamin-binding protein [Tenacibaculum todarodis]
MKTYQDQIGNVLGLKKTPLRIVSLVPSQTELLVDLGLKDSIVGITKFCIHPSSLRKEKTIVGGTKTINTEKIKTLQPDIILCNKEENTKEIVEACLKIAPTHVSDIFTIDDVIELINQYGEIFDCVSKSSEILDDLTNKLTNFQQFIKGEKTIKVAYFIWKNPWMVAGNTTFINHLLELNNFENVFRDKERYPEVDITKRSSVDAILLSSEPYPFKEKHILELQKKLPNVKVILVDGEMFSWYGSRLLKAFEYFKTLRNSI